jgi:hypothetical protein
MLLNSKAARESRESALRARWELNVATDEELIELALLMEEPLSEDDEAMDVLKLVLANGATAEVRSLARVWMNYFRIMSILGPEAERRAIDDGTSLCFEENGPHAAASCLLVATALDFEPAQFERKIALLRRSIELEPNWLLNHACLAYVYEIQGARELERAEMALARANAQTPNPEAGIVEWSFRTFISGEWGSHWQ